MIAADAPIRAVVLDFGGVLITPITQLIDEIAAWHGITMVEMLDVLMGPRESSTADHPWHRAERGELAIGDAAGRGRPVRRRRPGSRCGATSTSGCCAACSTVHHDVVERIGRTARRGLPHRVC